MNAPVQTPRPERPAKKPRRRPARPYPVSADTFGPAFVLTVLIHLLLFKGASSSGLFLSPPVKIAATPAVKPVQVTTAPEATPIPANLLPPQMRPTPPKFVEVNPMAPSLKPENTNNTGAADQRAAQPLPDPVANGERPRVQGETPDSTRIVQAIPRELLPREMQPAPGSPLGAPVKPTKPSPASPEKTSAPARASDGPAARADLPQAKPAAEKGAAFVEKPGEERPVAAKSADKKPDEPSDKKTEGAKTGEKTADAKPEKKATPEISRNPSVSENAAQPSGRDAPAKPRPRASIAGTSGPLGVSTSGAGNAGTLALNAKFSRYGEYTSRMYEIIQAAWWVGVDRSRLDETGTVVIEFTLHKDGTVTGASIMEKTTSARAAYLCLDSIIGRAPFDPWPEDMVGFLGEKQEARLTFHYR